MLQIPRSPDGRLQADLAPFLLLPSGEFLADVASEEGWVLEQQLGTRRSAARDVHGG
jgi:hypothetical protein